MEISKKIKIFFLYYLPLIFWLGIIFYFSGIPDLKTGASSVSGEIFLRKGAHFLEYFILACLIFRIFFNLKKIKARDSFVATIVLALIYAATDEYHQSLVLGRAGKMVDVFFDSLSSLLFLQLFFLFKFRKKFLIKISGILLVILVLIGVEIRMTQNGKVLQNSNKEEIVTENNILVEPESRNEKQIIEKEILPEKKISESILIEVPFTTQAPFANWDEFHEEACEEASLIMVKYFLDKKALSPEIAEKEIQALIKFQLKEYGDYKDSSAQELVGLADDYYGIKNLKVIYDFSKDDLKKYLSLGKPIIIPAAGRLLGNPNFKAPGPLYHNLVLIGYNKDVIITNDPGTRKGEGYTYNLNILYKAIHDFSGKVEEIEKGRKAMIVIE